MAYLLTFNLHRIYKIPAHRPVDPAPAETTAATGSCNQPWMRRWAFTGVMLFVMFPLTGTGAPGRRDPRPAGRAERG